MTTTAKPGTNGAHEVSEEMEGGDEPEFTTAEVGGTDQEALDALVDMLTAGCPEELCSDFLHPSIIDPRDLDRFRRIVVVLARQSMPRTTFDWMRLRDMGLVECRMAFDRRGQALVFREAFGKKLRRALGGDDPIQRKASAAAVAGVLAGDATQTRLVEESLAARDRSLHEIEDEARRSAARDLDAIGLSLQRGERTRRQLLQHLDPPPARIVRVINEGADPVAATRTSTILDGRAMPALDGQDAVNETARRSPTAVSAMHRERREDDELHVELGHPGDPADSDPGGDRESAGVTAMAAQEPGNGGGLTGQPGRRKAPPPPEWAPSLDATAANGRDPLPHVPHPPDPVAAVLSGRATGPFRGR